MSINNFVLIFMLLSQADDEAMDLNKDLVLKLLELDDVDAVYTDQKWVLVLNCGLLTLKTLSDYSPSAVT